MEGKESNAESLGFNVTFVVILLGWDVFSEDLPCWEISDCTAEVGCIDSGGICDIMVFK